MPLPAIPSEAQPYPRSRFQYDLLFYLLCLVFLYLNLFSLPFTPIFYEADHLNLLNDAKRMVEGEVIYRDFFEFLFPGAPSLFALLMAIFGPKYWLVSMVILVHGMFAAFLGVQISRRVLRDTFAAYLPSAIFIFFGFRWFGVDGEHRMISPLFAYLAILVLLPKRNLPRLALAGIACAFASFFTQQRGFLAVAAIGVCLLIEFGVVGRQWSQFFKSSLMFGGVFIAALGLMLVPFILAAGPEQVFNDTFVFLTAYAQDPATNSLQTYISTITKIRSFGNVMTLATLFYSILIPLIYVAALIFLAIRRRHAGFENIAGVVLLCLVGLFLSIGTTGPNVYRLFQVSLPAVIVLVWLIYQSKLVTPAVAKAVVAALAIFGIALGIRLQSAWETVTLDTASGRLVFLSPVISERYEWLLENARPGDLVYETYNSHVNFPLGLRNPCRLSILLNTGYSPPEHVNWAIEDLKRTRPRYIIWDGAWTGEMSQLADGERLKPFYRLMSAYYRPVRSFTPYDGREREVWERIGP